MVQIKWLTEAKIDLKEIYEYIALNSKRYARHQVEGIKDSTKLLKTQPRLGKIVKEMDNPDLRELVEGNYRIVYQIINSNRIHILMVHHGARNLSSRFTQ